MPHFRSIADIRRDYGDLELKEDSMATDPIAQFELWFEEVLKNETHDPTAMLLSTVDELGLPDARVVLLKGFDEGDFVFYTNYESAKAQQLAHKPYAALTFYWPHMARQVRVRGKVEKVSRQLSDAYFSSRPIASQHSAIVSPQSQEIKDRACLEEALNQLIQTHGQELVVRPKNWGGYRVIPNEIEFWQGRDSRLHDRIQYYQKDGKWQHRRLAP